MKFPSLTLPVKPSEKRSQRRLSGIPSRSQFAALEARTLYSADLGLAGSFAGAEQASLAENAPLKTAAYAQDARTVDKTLPALGKSTLQDRDNTTDIIRLMGDFNLSKNEVGLEIVLIDSQVPDIQSLRSAFQRQIEAGRNLAVMVKIGRAHV